jgi:hypothetical protein
MYSETGERHHEPHFHAEYGEYEATFKIKDLQILKGFIPNKQRKLIEAWGEIHKKELINAWEILKSGLLPDKINPLR